MDNVQKYSYLVLYSGIGTFTLKRGKTKQIRIINFAQALLCIGVIFVLALSKLVL
ncbi:MAG: SirB2 family protein [Pseudohongiellaceae bacterium]